MNGAPTMEFLISKGVCQIHRLSLFLFIITMEGLSIDLMNACCKGLFHGLQIPKSNSCISHLFYADDALFISEWKRCNFKNLTRILRCFHASFGLRVNFFKSMVFGIGVTDRELSHVLGCLVVNQDPFHSLTWESRWVLI